MRFYLGTHKPQWLPRTDVPLFVSRVSLAPRRTLPRAAGRWALDSGAFSELAAHGKWTVPAEQYAEEVCRFVDEIGGVDFAAPQDWMCEPDMLTRTGLSIAEHQRRTVESYLTLSDLGVTEVIPVLQGWTLSDYLACVALYEAAGIQLDRMELVGLGSVCRRESTGQIDDIVRRLSREDINLHGFGVKIAGLGLYGRKLASADSMAWSAQARYAGRPMVAGCPHGTCQNCLRWALRWRERVLRELDHEQLRLDEEA